MAEDIVLAASAARTATETFEAKPNYHYRGAIIIIDVTAVTATPSVVFTVRGHDPASNKTWDILASAAIAAVGTTVLRIHPELTAAANSIAKDALPAMWEVRAVAADADSMTYSIGAVLIE